MEAGHIRVPQSPEPFHVPVVEELPRKYRKLLLAPEADPYRIIRGSKEISKFEICK